MDPFLAMSRTSLNFLVLATTPLTVKAFGSDDCDSSVLGLCGADLAKIWLFEGI